MAGTTFQVLSRPLGLLFALSWSPSCKGSYAVRMLKQLSREVTWPPANNSTRYVRDHLGSRTSRLRWLMAPVLISPEEEHFRHCRKFYWTVLIWKCRLLITEMLQNVKCMKGLGPVDLEKSLNEMEISAYNASRVTDEFKQWRGVDKRRRRKMSDLIILVF